MVDTSKATRKPMTARSRRWAALVAAVAVFAVLPMGQSVAHVEAQEPSRFGLSVTSIRLTMVGEPFDAMVLVVNSTQGAADDVVVTAEVPEGWNVTASGDEAGRTCEVDPTERLVRCEYGTMPANDIRFIDLSVTPPDEPGTGTIVATLETGSPETEPREASTEIVVGPPGVDIVHDSVRQENPTVPRVGESSEFVWTFRNHTFGRVVRDLTATVDVPAGASVVVSLGYVGHQIEPPSAECASAPGARRISCTLPGAWPDFLYEVFLDVVYEEAGSYPFTVTMSQSSEEQAPGDETMTHTVEVEDRLPGFWMDTTASADELTVGDTYSYVVLVGNDGDQPLRDFDVSDTFPANARPLSATVGWDAKPCDVVWNRFACHFDRLPSGGTRFIVVRAEARGAGTVANDPTLRQYRPAPNPTVLVRRPLHLEVVEPGDESPTDLALASRAAAGPVVAGEPVTTVVEIENRGRRAATDVALRLDGDPTNLEVVSATHGWFQLDCATDGATVCTIPTIYASGSTFVEVTTRPLAPGPFGATLTVGSETVELTGEAVEGP